MKVLKYLWSFFLIAGILKSCSDDDLTQLGNVAPPSIQSPSNGQTFVLDREEANNIATTISWTDVSYEANTPLVSYIVEMAASGTNFSNPVSVVSTMETSYDITVGLLNSKAISAGLTPDVPGNVEIRVSAKIGANYLISSTPVSLTITTYEDVLDLSSTWGIVGSAAPNGWDGPDVPFYKQQGPENQGILVAYATLTDGVIKFRENNDWTNNYGGSGGNLVPNGDNIPVTAGSYKITMNLNNLTYEIQPFYLGIVGSATPNGWDGPDLQLNYDPTSDQFRALVTLTDGEIKFRMNNDWGTNWGGSNGNLEAGGDNITVTAGNYVVTVNFAANTYQLQPIDHVWGLVGSATPNGWNGPDVPFEIDYTSDFSTNNGANAVWVIKNLALTAGEVKFRADNDWSLNYGGSGLSGDLVEGGDNIVVPAGNFDVVLNLGELSYTITPLN